MAPTNLVNLFDSRRVHTVQYILSGWKVIQKTQFDFVDSQVFFDALVLIYLS
jgi:hypothetical protein